MKPGLLIAALMLLTVPAQAECALDQIEAALNAPLDAMKPLERDVTDVQSTEGGAWQIYREKDGRVNTIIRIDGGESGRQDTRLSIVNRQTYGIASTRTDYIRHAFMEGPFANAKRTTDYYYFCGGKVYLPDPNSSMVDIGQYPKNATAAQKAMLDDRDVADFTKGLAR